MEVSQLEELKDKWIKSLIIENKSPASIKAYVADLKAFFKYIEEFEMNITDMEITDARDFILYRNESIGNKVSSTKRLISTIKLFFNWMVEEGAVLVNPFQDVKIKRQDKSLPHIMSEEEIAIFLDTDISADASDLEKELWIRDKAIIEIMYSSGLRVSEVGSLKIKDIDIPQKLIKVIGGKGSKDRVVPVGGKAIEALNKWYVLRNTWNISADVDYCFVSQTLGKKMTGGGIWKRVVKHGKRMGIAADNLNYNNIHPHLFRHCFATHLLNATDNLRAIQDMLGHENIGTTAIYTHVSTNKLMKEYDNAHPRARLKGNKTK